MSKKTSTSHRTAETNKSDTSTTIEMLKNKAHTVFDIEREWDQFHPLKNLSMNIATEAAELMEHFLWITTEESSTVLQDPQKKEAVAHELADVLIGVVQFARKADIDLSKSFFDKMKLIEKKYPISKAKGVNKKYTELK